MPVYEYKCRNCLKTHEVLQRFSDAPMSLCPDCGGPVQKLISNTSFVLKGTGWYVTDYARKGTTTPSTTTEKGAVTPDGKGAATPATGEKGSMTPPPDGKGSTTTSEKGSAAPSEKGPVTQEKGLRP